MKSTMQAIFSNVFQNFTKLIGGLLVLTIVCQTVLLGSTEAIAAPLFATSASSLSKEMSGKADEMKGNAKQKIGKMQSAMEDKKGELKQKVKDDLTDTKIAIDGNNAKAENAIDKAADGVKGFFGK
jgi:Skp family chaperone for outer membrane proteins